MTKHQVRLIGLSLGMLCLVAMLTPAVSHATTILDTMKANIEGSSLPQTTGPEGIELVVGKVIQAFLSLFGVVFLVLMIYGGYKWLMAQGRDEEITKAKDTIRAAIIGLAIILSAYVITVYVVSALTSAAGVTPEGGAEDVAGGSEQD